MTHIPSGWESAALERLCRVIYRYPGFYGMEHLKGGVPVVRGEHLTGRNTISEDWSDYWFVSEEYAAGFPKTRLEVGDIVMSVRGSIGTMARATEAHAGAQISPNTIRIAPDPRVVAPLFLFHALKRIVPKAVVEAAQDQALPALAASDIKHFQLPLPPRAEQERIGAILELWSKSTEVVESLIRGTVALKLGLMQQLLTGQTRFREYVKSTKQVNTRYGCFPADWAAVHIGDVADEISGKNDGGRELPVLSCTKHRGLVNSLEYFGKRIFSADTSNYKVVRRGNFAYATNHIEEGSIGYQDLHDAALISPMYTVFRTRAGVDHPFFFKLVKTELYRHIFEVNTSGSIARRGGLRWNEFAIIKVFLPSVPEQKRIASVLSTCDREIELLQKQLAAFKEQKRGLMQKLLTGEVRVKV